MYPSLKTSILIPVSLSNFDTAELKARNPFALVIKSTSFESACWFLNVRENKLHPLGCRSCFATSDFL